MEAIYVLLRTFKNRIFFPLIFVIVGPISSDFSDLSDMTDEYIGLSAYSLTGWLLYVLYLT